MSGTSIRVFEIRAPVDAVLDAVDLVTLEDVVAELPAVCARDVRR